jgi:hypothetical protein
MFLLRDFKLHNEMAGNGDGICLVYDKKLKYFEKSKLKNIYLEYFIIDINVMPQIVSGCLMNRNYGIRQRGAKQYSPNDLKSE